MSSREEHSKRMEALGLRILLIVSEFNTKVTEGLSKGACACLLENGLSTEQWAEIRVPGAFEIPLAAKWATKWAAKRSANRDGERGMNYRNGNEHATQFNKHAKSDKFDESSKLTTSTKSTKRYDGIIALGCVIKGETKHDDYIAAHAISGIGQVSLASQIPISLGILTTYTLEQALERSGEGKANKGYESAHALLKMIDAREHLKAVLSE